MHFIGQAQIIKILKLRNNIIICEYLPACAPGRLALPVCHRLHLRRMPGGLGWRASSHGRRVCEKLLAP
jgi:hypothetical protein